jgi:hypothetical protein
VVILYHRRPIVREFLWDKNHRLLFKDKPCLVVKYIIGCFRWWSRGFVVRVFEEDLGGCRRMR